MSKDQYLANKGLEDGSGNAFDDTQQLSYGEWELYKTAYKINAAKPSSRTYAREIIQRGFNELQNNGFRNAVSKRKSSF